jgi:hypothetical protein
MLAIGARDTSTSVVSGMQVGQVADAVGQERAGRAVLIFAGNPDSACRHMM